MNQKIYPKSELLWTFDFIIILLLSVITSSIDAMMSANLPLYVKILGGNNLLAGLVTGVFMVAAIIVRPFWGYLSDTMGRRIVVLLGTTIVTVVSFSYTFVSNILIILLLRFINGIGFSANTNTTATMASDIIPNDRISEGIGYYGVSKVIATAIGPAFGIYLISTFNHKTFFLAAGVVGMLSTFIAYTIKYEKNLLKDKRFTIKPEKEKIVTVEKAALPASMVMLFISLGSGGLISFIPILSTTRGIENYGTYYTVYALALLSTRLFVGRIADRYGSNKVIIPAMGFLILGFITFALTYSFHTLLLGGIFYGLGHGTVQPMLNAIMIKNCPRERRGSGNSTFYISMDLGNALGSAIAGAVSQFFGFTVLYLFSVIYIVIAFAIYSSFGKNSKKNILKYLS